MHGREAGRRNETAKNLLHKQCVVHFGRPRISPIFSPFFPVFCAFSPARRDGPNEPQAGTHGQETGSWQASSKAYLGVGVEGRRSGGAQAKPSRTPL